MQSEVAERMNDLVTQSGRNGEGSAVDYSSGRSGRQGARVTNSTADLIEKGVATHCGRRYWVLPARSTRRRHEVRKRENIPTVIFRIDDRIERRSGDVDYTFSRGRRIFVRAGIGC